MAGDELFSEWRDGNTDSKYPFSESATLVNSNGFFIPEEMFLDARIYAEGGTARQYLSGITIEADEITLTISDPYTVLATASFDVSSPPDDLALEDLNGRPAGVLISSSSALGALSSWGVGDYVFTIAQTEFAATVVVPSPQTGVTGFVLEDGTLFSRDVILVGRDGVVLTVEDGNIVVNVVGEPLFKRKICEEEGYFDTPRFIQTINNVVPDDYGNFGLFISTDTVPDPILRIRRTSNGLRLYAVGMLLHENSRIGL